MRRRTVAAAAEPLRPRSYEIEPGREDGFRSAESAAWFHRFFATRRVTIERPLEQLEGDDLPFYWERISRYVGWTDWFVAREVDVTILRLLVASLVQDPQDPLLYHAYVRGVPFDVSLDSISIATGIPLVEDPFYPSEAPLPADVTWHRMVRVLTGGEVQAMPGTGKLRYSLLSAEYRLLWLALSGCVLALSHVEDLSESQIRFLYAVGTEREVCLVRIFWGLIIQSTGAGSTCHIKGASVLHVLAMRADVPVSLAGDEIRPSREGPIGPSAGVRSTAQIRYQERLAQEAAARATAAREAVDQGVAGQEIAGQGAVRQEATAEDVAGLEEMGDEPFGLEGLGREEGDERPRQRRRMDAGESFADDRAGGSDQEGREWRLSMEARMGALEGEVRELRAMTEAHMATTEREARRSRMRADSTLAVLRRTEFMVEYFLHRAQILRPLPVPAPVYEEGDVPTVRFIPRLVTSSVASPSGVRGQGTGGSSASPGGQDVARGQDPPRGQDGAVERQDLPRGQDGVVEGQDVAGGQDVTGGQDPPGLVEPQGGD